MAATLTNVNQLSENIATAYFGGSNEFRTCLIDGDWTPAVTDNTWSNVSANELPTAAGYTQGGYTHTMTISRTDDDTKVDADDATWTASGTLAAPYAVLVKCANGTSLQASDEIVAYANLNGGADYSVTDNAFTVQWSASGIITISNAA